MSVGYQEFIGRKRQSGSQSGFEPIWLPDSLFPFQRHLTEWAIRQGRAALFEDCGLGKTLQQLVWGENVVRNTNKPVLILTPLAVSYQTSGEGAKFGIEVKRSSDGKHSGAGLVVTNYQRLHYFDPADFAGVVCDESSILKNFDGKLKEQITEFMRQVPYRLLCTATAAPNDYHELGTSSEALGYLGYTDMVTRFFKEDTIKDYLGWGRKAYRFRGHAEEPFWRWVCSWARACRKPSDVGCDDSNVILPELCEREVVLETGICRDGMLLPMPARDLREQREERRVTLNKRCEYAAEVACEARLEDPSNGACVLWCHLNEEADTLEKMLPDAKQVSGSMSDEQKEEYLLAFQRGELKTLITKPKIGCYGLNWQHCHNVVTFPSHSWEQYYQAVRRCWRFGQKNPVTVTIVSTEGEVGVLANLQRKARQADSMFASLTKHVVDAMHLEKQTEYTLAEKVPAWLS